MRKLSDTFSKVAANLHQRVDPPQQNPATKSASITHKVRPTLTKPIPSEQTNTIEDYYGNSPTSFQRNVHMSPSGPHTILQDFPVPPPMVRPAQPPRVNTGGTSSNLRSRGNKNPVPNFALSAQFQQVREANTVTHKISGVSQKYRHLVKGPDRKIWERSFANELEQLSQGIITVKGTNSVIFISKTQVPKDEKFTYGKIVCKVKPEKKERERTGLTVGGNLLDFTGNISSPTAPVTIEKCVFNSMVSTPGARCLLTNIKHFYLNNVLPEPEFMRIPLKMIPQEIIDAYNLTALVDNQGWIHMRIEKGMYGLKQAGTIANK